MQLKSVVKDSFTSTVVLNFIVDAFSNEIKKSYLNPSGLVLSVEKITRYDYCLKAL